MLPILSLPDDLGIRLLSLSRCVLLIHMLCAHFLIVNCLYLSTVPSGAVAVLYACSHTRRATWHCTVTSTTSCFDLFAGPCRVKYDSLTVLNELLSVSSTLAPARLQAQGTPSPACSSLQRLVVKLIMLRRSATWQQDCTHSFSQRDSLISHMSRLTSYRSMATGCRCIDSAWQLRRIS